MLVTLEKALGPTAEFFYCYIGYMRLTNSQEDMWKSFDCFGDVCQLI